MGPIRFAALALAALTLAACTTLPPRTPSPWELPYPERPQRRPPSGPPVVEQPPQPPPPVAFELGALPGWAEDDHAGAFAAYLQTCQVARDPAYAAVCDKARQAGPLDEAAARRFFETNFRAAPSGPDGLLTAYFSPEYEARFSSQGEFTAPVRPRPPLLPAGGQPWYDRATIEQTPEARPLAWMRPEDLFFLQIQGSGTLVLPDGRRIKAIFDGHNGQPFVGIAAPMRDIGLLPGNNTSGTAIRNWLAEHRGPDADAIMRLNPRYVFFRTAPDDGLDPAGAAGVPLPPGRAIAVDLSRHVLGEPYWIEAHAPVLTGAFPAYRRLVMALDTGGAIKGETRADLYIGKGDAAGAEAGRVKHTLRMYRLVPVVP
ncbi:MAG TPA: MltA domain-containing protein [Caulobacteraceae bacterium]